MDLDGSHQESSPAAQPVISRCQTVNANTAIYFPSSNTFLWIIPQIYYLLCIDCYYLFMLINHKSGVKSSMRIYHIFLAAVGNNNNICQRSCSALKCLLCVQLVLVLMLKNFLCHETNFCKFLWEKNDWTVTKIFFSCSTFRLVLLCGLPLSTSLRSNTSSGPFSGPKLDYVKEIFEPKCT
jgi:hypothetical protein